MLRADCYTIPFKPNASIYSVYSTESEIKLDRLPAMKFTDGTQNYYRLGSYYFTSADVSTSMLEPRCIDTILHLKYGTVLYTPVKSEAEKFARGLRNKMVEQKKAEITRLRAEIATLLKIKTTYDPDSKK